MADDILDPKSPWTNTHPPNVQPCGPPLSSPESMLARSCTLSTARSGSLSRCLSPVSLATRLSWTGQHPLCSSQARQSAHRWQTIGQMRTPCEHSCCPVRALCHCAVRSGPSCWTCGCGAGPSWRAAPRRHIHIGPRVAAVLLPWVGHWQCRFRSRRQRQRRPRSAAARCHWLALSV